MEVLLFFVEALIVFTLAVLFGGTMIGYYFQKRYEYEAKRLQAFGNALMKSKTDDKNG